jgi:hypothetical protein
MSDSLKIKITRYLKDLYIDDIIELKPTTSITPWGTDNFIWEGSYQGEKITVNLPRQTFKEDATIKKNDTLNISNHIFTELKRVLK